MENQNRKPKAAQRGMVAAIIIPLVAAIISAFGGALANHYFASLSAADKTVEGIDTFLGVALSTVELARRTQAAPELVVKLEQLVSQSRAIQVNLQLLNRSSDGASREVDFWLPFGQSVVLGEKNSFGIQKRGTGGGISRRFNEQMMRAMFPGNRLAYETSSGKECFLAYIGPSPDGDLHGFRTLCSEEK